MAGTFVTPKREEFALFLKSVPLAKITLSVFVLKDRLIKSPKISELKGKLLGHKRGFIMSKELDLAAKEGVIKLYNVETVEQLVKMILRHRLDAFCHTTDNALYYIKKLDKKQRIKCLTPPVTIGRKSYIAFSKKSLKKLPKEFFDTITKALEAMKREGLLDTIYAKHGY